VARKPDGISDPLARLALLDQAERRQALAEIAAQDPELADALKSLLSAHDAGREFLQHLDADKALGLLRDDEQRAMPEQIGNYRLVREIGRGGLGVVYLAERNIGDFEQHVAIKLIKRGMDSELILKRFQHERRILASLKHANIAHLIDGGLLDDGRPWFAMEYVEGLSITEWCDRQQATVTQRLALFEQVCHAVQYAHARLIVHRDLKPANILVAEGAAGNGAIKLLDFGIAKLLDTDDDSGTFMTVAGLQAMTPEYAAPEQVRGEPVSTATDIYALGVVLYELLSGHHPYKLATSGRKSLAEAICNTAPTHPSAMVGGDTADSIATARGSRPSALRRCLNGDLDNVVLMAMAREPERRYNSAEALAEDIRRYLEGLPVKARPDTAAYRAARFISRHTLSVATTAVFVLLLMASIMALVIQQADTVRERDQARLERDKAEAVTNFLSGMFAEADPFNEHQGSMTVQDALELGMQRLQTELHDRPTIRAHLMRAIGATYLQHYQPEKARPLIAEALALERGLHDAAHPDLAATIGLQARLQSSFGDKESALTFKREELDMLRQLHGDHNRFVARSLAGVGVILLEAGRCIEAEPVLREALNMFESVTGHDINFAGWSNILGRTLTCLGEYEEAEIFLQKATRIRQGLFPPDHPTMATVHGNLGIILMHQGRFSEAEPLLRSALEINRQALGDAHYRVPLSLNNLGQLLWWLGDENGAAMSHREAQAIREDYHFHDPRNGVRGLALLARLEHASGNHDDSEQLFKQALAQSPDKLSETNLILAESRLGLGWLLIELGRLQEAEPMLEDAMARRLAGTGSDSDLTAEARVALGLLRASQGRAEEALNLLEPGLERLGRFALADPDMVESAHRVLGQLYDRTSGTN
jgi:eukaryotic-like serine/threonine-protein kinase